jgi:NADPH-dependent 2,4-dienoyl-CoA reductase/sulfur reductase-like enzyme
VPLYEIALLSAARAREAGHDLQVSVITAEAQPLTVFGPEAGAELTRRLEAAGIALYLGSTYQVGADRAVRLADGRTVSAQRVLTLPTIIGPNVAGVPGDARLRFIPIDDRCRVPDSAGRLFAAGDATPSAVKHGGLAAQQADVAASGIAYLAGAGDAPGPIHLVIEAQVLTGAEPLYLRAHLVGGQGWRGQLFDRPPWPEQDKIVATDLGSYLRDHGFTAARL